MTVVGLGGQDTIAQAQEFMDSTGTGGGEIKMIWDIDRAIPSWQEFGVRSQPYWILYDADGNETKSSPGRVDLEAVQAVLSS